MTRASCDRVVGAVQSGNTPLGRAAVYGHVDTVQYLVGAGATVDGRNNGGETPLIRACRWGHKPVVAALVAAGANVALQDLVSMCAGLSV